jgi:hypothetical protein
LTRKFICDNCGTEFDDPDKIKALETVDVLDSDRIDDELGDFCRDCLATLKEAIKAGFSKGRA